MDVETLIKYRRSPFVSAEAFQDACDANPKVFEELVLKDSLLEEYKEINKSNISMNKKLDYIVNLIKTQREISTGSALQSLYESERN